LTDDELMRRSASEPALFGVLYERYELVVRRYVTRRVGAGDGEDLAAEVFARAFRSRGRYRAEYTSVLPWLMGVANNVIADHRRIERRRQLTPELSRLHQERGSLC
jgi:DNA-directed RNA polymerase specialized sigma24 family protein